MVGLAVALKYALPAVLVGGGVVAAIAVPETAASPPRQVWIDSPFDGARVEPGTMTVVAHAADGTRLKSMTLQVDGTEVDTASDLTRFDRLAGVQFTWQATEGRHFLVVTGKGLSSAVVAVDVGVTQLGSPDPSAGPQSTSSPTASPTASPSAPTSATPTTVPSGSPTSEPTGPPTATPSTTQTPTPSASPTPSDPVIGEVSVSPSPIGPPTPDCTGDVVVRAQTTGATGGSAFVIGQDVNTNIGGSVNNGVFIATFRQRDLADRNLSGTFRVEVTVTNETGFDVGAASVDIYCAKD